MKRSNVYGILLVFILSFNILFLFSNNDTQPDLVSVVSSNNSLMSSGTYVTNSGDLAVSVDDPTNHTISWTLTDFTAFDYLGLYSFTEDNAGSNPSGWTVSEPSGTNISVVSQMNTHNQVVLLDDNSLSEYCVFENTFIPQTSGAIEWWFLMPDVSTPIHFSFKNSSFSTDYTINLVISYDYLGATENYLSYYQGSSASFQPLTPLEDNVWYHVSLTFECGSGGYDGLNQYFCNLYLNETKYGPFEFAANNSDIARIHFNTYDFPRQPSEIYLDAIDYSWAPGYYPNRNMDLTLSETRDYLGIYSFTEDTLGSDPAGWTVTELSGTNISVLSDKNFHNKVVFLDDNSLSDFCRFENTFSPQTSGAIEWWFLMPDVSAPIHFSFENSTFSSEYTINLAISYDYLASQENYLSYYDGSSFQSIAELTDDTWYHVRITFECGSGAYDNLSQYKFNLYLNGAKYGPLPFMVNQSNIAKMHINTYDFPRQPSEIYIDAVDYSWAPGYYPNRNLDVGPIDYLGEYSFTEDASGSHPAGWTTLEPVSTFISVVNSYQDHNKIVYLDDNSVSDYCEIYDNFNGVSSGEMEVWFLMPDVSTPFHIQLLDENYSNYVCGLSVSDDYRGGAENWLSRFDGISNYDIVELKDNIWYHLRFTFECGSGGYENLSQDTWKFYLNGVMYGPYNCISDQSNVGWIRIQTYDSPRQPSEIYLDAIDYSWAPGYYINRNMDFNISSTSLVYAVYENDTRMTNWQIWNNNVQVEYNVSSTGLGIGIHNISLVYNDRDGNWYHDDVIVTVSATTQLTIISDPVDFDISGNRKCDVSIKLNNSGNTILTNINVTIEVPAGWSADLHIRTVNQLAPGEIVTITYKLTAPETYEAEDVAIMTINITAEILGTGQLWSDSLSFYVIGIDPGLPIWIWIIIVIGSAAAASTSYIVFRQRRNRSMEPTGKGKYKNREYLKAGLSKDLPGTYTIPFKKLQERIQGISNLTKPEKEQMFQDIMQLDEKDAEKWLDEFETYFRE